ncbi:MltA domain-containing protein [Brevundimonas sp. 2R-24]|uniref:peptidoglycan lytic exotransglycosylase n=1 Tax=Peiella sedimenti TaxID=3061083 RepID=A0ABT8SKL4_9CAUL|nr:MltA domain-containing protein [Caulobacteraceae bacterium XZ-24]
MRLKALAPLVLAAAVSACASLPESEPGPTPSPQAPSPPPPAPAQPPPPAPVPANFAGLDGWTQADHLAAFFAWRRACAAGVVRQAEAACAAALRGDLTDRVAARAYFETWFTPIRAEGEGLLTAYFAPEYEARTTPDAEFSAPVRPRPQLAEGPHPSRAEIEAVPAGDALAWMRPEDLFFMQIQGSGYLTLEDGRRVRAAFAAHNGHPFTGIARPMEARGLLPRGQTSGEAIRAWLAAHRGPEANEVMALNPRYVFFRLEPDDGGEPSGAAGVPLTARHAIAVDPAHWTYGDLVWIEASGASLPGAVAGYHALTVALDTGGAIRGPVRADFYMGRGEAAGREAGTVRHPLRMWRLAPRQSAD